MTYQNSNILLTTKHQKEVAISPAFNQHLSAKIICAELDTDTLGTFTGTVPRIYSPLECAKRKCLWGMEIFNHDYGLASEGSFGPHPHIPFAPCDHEILYFIDKTRGFHLHETVLCTKTNFKTQNITDLESLLLFAQQVEFPSHGIIINAKHSIDNHDQLELIFYEALKQDKNVFVQTDMRAHKNPTRMSVIAELADKLAQRIATFCPSCQYPGFGKTKVETGLLCSDCGSETELVRTEIFGCVTCDYQEKKPRADGLINAQPRFCHYCNP